MHIHALLLGYWPQREGSGEDMGACSLLAARSALTEAKSSAMLIKKLYRCHESDRRVGGTFVEHRSIFS